MLFTLDTQKASIDTQDRAALCTDANSRLNVHFLFTDRLRTERALNLQPGNALIIVTEGERILAASVPQLIPGIHALLHKPLLSDRATHTEW